MAETDAAEPADASPRLPAPFDLQGHRGARGLLPENTIPAFLLALELGVTTLEMDVVVTRDRQVVVSHDPWFSSVICSLPSGEPVSPEAEPSLRLFDLPYDEVARFDCGRRGHPFFPRQKAQPASKPRLRDVIAAAEEHADRLGRARPHYNIETKSRPEGDGVLHPGPEAFVRLLYDVLVEMDVKARSLVQSFDLRTLRAARTLDASLGLVLLIGQQEDEGLEANLAALGFTPAVYSPDYRLVDAALVEAAHARGMAVIPWTVNTLEDMQRLQGLGVEGLITDYPDVGRALL